MQAGLELRGISKFVGGERYLEDLSLQCEPGTLTVLLGRVRSGKTTLLRTMAGLDVPDRGHVLWNGHDVTRVSVRHRDVAMVYQQFVNYPSLSVYENIASPLRIQKRHTRAEIDRRVREVATLLRIENLLTRLPAELSGGQQQRTAIARALAKSAKLVLLDEPLANLDYKLREGLRDELQDVFRGTDTCVVYATSEPNEALWFGARVALMHEGRLLQVGSAREVYAAPRTETAGRVYSDPEMNVFDLTVEASKAHATAHPELAFEALGALRNLEPGQYRAGVRAHDVHVQRASDRDGRVKAVVTLEEITGGETLLRAAAGPLTWTAQLHGVREYALGDELELFIAPEHVVIFERESDAPTSAASGHGAH
jgi:glycerol transport system ATP-binding protein